MDNMMFWPLAPLFQSKHLRPLPFRCPLRLLFSLSFFLEEVRYLKVQPFISVRRLHVRRVVFKGGQNAGKVIVGDLHAS